MVFRRIGGRIVAIKAKTPTKILAQTERIVAKSGSKKLAKKMNELKSMFDSHVYKKASSTMRFAGVPSNSPVPYNIFRSKAVSISKQALKSSRKIK